MGHGNSFSSFGGLVGPHDSTISGPFASASVSGGYYNTANGFYSSVSGGGYNTASVPYASVSGGYYNTAGGNYSSVSGGYKNVANGAYSSVSGGLGSVIGMDDWRAGSLFETN